MIFGRLINVLAAMNTSKLSCLCHQPILFRDRAQKQEMPGHRAIATKITGTDRNVLATARSHLRRVTWFSALGVHLLPTGRCTFPDRSSLETRIADLSLIEIQMSR
jgi:hypothetical protein